MAVKVRERPSNSKWRELLGRYIFRVKERDNSSSLGANRNRFPT